MDLTPDSKADPLLPLVAEVVSGILQAGDIVTPLDVLVRLEILAPEVVEAWRRGELPYLERGITTGLTRTSRLLRVLHQHALSIGLTPVPGKYVRRDKGAKRKLRFSKRGDADSELAYSRHFVRTKTP